MIHETVRTSMQRPALTRLTSATPSGAKRFVSPTFIAARNTSKDEEVTSATGVCCGVVSSEGKGGSWADVSGSRGSGLGVAP